MKKYLGQNWEIENLKTQNQINMIVKWFSKIICLSVLVISLNFIFATQLKAQNTTGTFSGRVTNIKGEGIAGLGITLDSSRAVFKEKTKKDGSFSFKVIEGIYKVYTDSWTGQLSYNDDLYMPEGFKSFFRPATRGNIQIQTGEDVKLNIILFESYAISKDSNFKERDSMSSPVVSYSHILPHSISEYDIIGFGEKLGNYVNIVVQYGSRYYEKGKIIYNSNIFLQNLSIFGTKGKFPGVVFTYDRITIYADLMIHDQNKHTLELLGNVVYENGLHQTRHKKLKIKIKENKPIITVV